MLEEILGMFVGISPKNRQRNMFVGNSAHIILMCCFGRRNMPGQSGSLQHILM